jgi:hypothetical protein
MTAEEYRDFRHRAVHALMALNKQCEEKFGIGKWERWDYDLDAGTLVFSEAGTPKIVAEVQAVGTTSTNSKTWLWSWANESMTPTVTNRMTQVRQFGVENAISELTEATLPDDEYLGWGVTAVTVALLGGKGAYRCPSDRGGYLYFMYTDIAVADLPTVHTQREDKRSQIECDQHGSGCAAYVCQHIFANPKQEWFSDNPTPTDPWPDAWCTECDRLYQAEGEWNDSNSETLKIKLICHHCYESFKTQQTSSTFRRDR